MTGGVLDGVAAPAPRACCGRWKGLTGSRVSDARDGAGVRAGAAGARAARRQPSGTGTPPGAWASVSDTGRPRLGRRTIRPGCAHRRGSRNVRAALAWLEATGDGIGMLWLAGAIRPLWELHGHRSKGSSGWTGAGPGPRCTGPGTHPRADRPWALSRGARARRAGRGRIRGTAGAGPRAQGRGRGSPSAPLARPGAGQPGALRRGDSADRGALAATGGWATRAGPAVPLLLRYHRLRAGDLAAAAAHLETALAWWRDAAASRTSPFPQRARPRRLRPRGRPGGHRTAGGGPSRVAGRRETGGPGRVAGCCCPAGGLPRAGTAGRLYGAAEALFDAVGQPLVVPPRSLYRRHVDALRATLGADAFAATWAAGRALPLEQAIEEARAVTADTVADEAASPDGAPAGVPPDPPRAGCAAPARRGPDRPRDRRRPSSSAAAPSMPTSPTSSASSASGSRREAADLSHPPPVPRLRPG